MFPNAKNLTGRLYSQPINENLLYSKIVELKKGNNNYWCEFDNERNTNADSASFIFGLQTVVKLKILLNNM
jgi:hypothetical protein